MPRVDVPVTSITRTGVGDAAPVVGDPVDFHSVVNDGSIWLEVENTGATIAHTLTVHLATTPDGQTVTPRTWSIPITTRRRIGPFPVRHYGTSLQVDVDDVELELSAYRVAAQG